MLSIEYIVVDLSVLNSMSICTISFGASACTKFVNITFSSLFSIPKLYGSLVGWKPNLPDTKTGCVKGEYAENSPSIYLYLVANLTNSFSNIASWSTNLITSKSNGLFSI